jgi:hypothetical protein
VSSDCTYTQDFPRGAAAGTGGTVITPEEVTVSPETWPVEAGISA